MVFVVFLLKKTLSEGAVVSALVFGHPAAFTHLAVLDPEKKSLNFIFPTKYVIPKSLAKFSQPGRS